MTSSGVVWELIHQKPNATAAAMIAENETLSLAKIIAVTMLQQRS